jgi:hypothetical protein
VHVGRGFRFLLLIFSAAAVLSAQQPVLPNLTTSGSIVVHGKQQPYTIQHLPVSSYPNLPDAVAQALMHRGCSIPQTYEAHGPENVIHGSFERAGSSDWAVLCAAHGTVSLLVFFGSVPGEAEVLATAPEMKRLYLSRELGALGFDWGIDAATPERVHEAQTGMEPRPAAINHDAVADSIIEQSVVYRYYANGKWGELPLQN